MCVQLWHTNLPYCTHKLPTPYVMYHLISITKYAHSHTTVHILCAPHLSFLQRGFCCPPPAVHALILALPAEQLLQIRTTKYTRLFPCLSLKYCKYGIILLSWSVLYLEVCLAPYIAPHFSVPTTCLCKKFSFSSILSLGLANTDKGLLTPYPENRYLVEIVI